MIQSDRFERAITTFDAYNLNDPHQELFEGKLVSKELLYAQRMSQRLDDFYPAAPEYLKLAAHCQHIGRWEIPRETYAMDKKGYLQWRNVLKSHHAKLAEQILASCRYEQETIDKVKSLLLKKELHSNADTQTLEDVICLVFIEHYLEEFAEKHEPQKVVDILQKTLKKMSPRAIEEAAKITVSERIKILLLQALQARASAK
ncbi:DUF4202 domain-containing protein [Chryseolinea sp. H1M3-3]|uniref:DUF4202 domain-containing protein n=1 Tax=Chryseolinea sp. H1M3-3 TaxID=3034144 RepID=UPI0023ED4926|nr:DUF4202 domain-containing protein [Chryseolinea sp. H1M3-3]